MFNSASRTPHRADRNLLGVGAVRSGGHHLKQETYACETPPIRGTSTRRGAARAQRGTGGLASVELIVDGPSEMCREFLQGLCR